MVYLIIFNIISAIVYLSLRRSTSKSIHIIGILSIVSFITYNIMMPKYMDIRVDLLLTLPLLIAVIITIFFRYRKSLKADT